MAENTKSVFETLNAVNVNDHTEKKNGLTYLSWSWAWAEVKKAYPSSTYKVYEDKDGCFYHTDGRTCWVKTGMTIEGIEHIEYLPVMDHRNASIPLDKVTSYDVNRAIQRSLTKAAARHGLGLYVYSGEDLPEGEEPPKEVLEPVLLAEAESLEIRLENVAAYLKKRVDEITNAELRACITRKKEQIERMKARNDSVHG